MVFADGCFRCDFRLECWFYCLSLNIQIWMGLWGNCFGPSPDSLTGIWVCLDFGISRSILPCSWLVWEFDCFSGQCAGGCLSGPTFGVVCCMWGPLGAVDRDFQGWTYLIKEMTCGAHELSNFKFKCCSCSFLAALIFWSSLSLRLVWLWFYYPNLGMWGFICRLGFCFLDLSTCL